MPPPVPTVATEPPTPRKLVPPVEEKAEPTDLTEDEIEKILKAAYT